MKPLRLYSDRDIHKRNLRRRIIFSIAILVLNNSHYGTWPLVLICTALGLVSLVAIWCPAAYRKAPFYITYGFIIWGLIFVASIQPGLTSIPVNLFVGPILIFVGASGTLELLGASLAFLTLLEMILLAPYPEAEWSALGFAGLYPSTF